MTDKEIKNLFMDYLYDEMTDEQKTEFEKNLDKHPELKKEFEELTSTSDLLQVVPVEVPPYKLVMMAPEHNQKGDSKESSNRGFLKRYPGLTTVLAAAACMLMILMVAAFTDLNIGQTDRGFYLAFGDIPTADPQPEIIQQGLSEEEVRDMMDQIRQENSILLASMIEQVQEQQNEQLEEAINVLTDYYDQRRQQDLLLISQGIAQLEEDTYNRLRQTDQTLGDLIYALSYSQTQSTEE